MNNSGKDILLIIPARNEALSLPAVLDMIPKEVSRFLVVDNGSTDGTAAIALSHGADVVTESFPGYGSACLAGIAYVSTNPPDIVAFADADGSDGVANLSTLLEPLLEDRADMALAQRIPVSRNSLSFQQKFGNRLAVILIRLFWGYTYHDLGPMRAIKWDSLSGLGMHDRTWGWTVEMQIKAVKSKIRIKEIPLPYYERISGRSKISRTVSGILKASVKIICVIVMELLPEGRVESKKRKARSFFKMERL